MENLPGAILLNIFEYLPVSDVFMHISPLNRNFSELTYSFYLLRLIVKRELGLSFFPIITKSQARSILETLFSKPANKLEFFGFITSGGVDENEMEYWCANLFREDGEAYCAHDDSNNCVIGGVLLDSLCDPRSYFDTVDSVTEILQKFAEDYNINTFQLIALDKALRFLQFYTGREELESKIAEKKEIPDLTLYDVKRFMDNDKMLMHKIEVEKADMSGFFAVIKGLKISRGGYYTCPVKTMMVFVSENFVDVSDEAFHVYDTARSYRKLKALLNRENIPEIEYISKKKSVQYCEFVPKPDSKVVPIVWVKFYSCSKLKIDLINKFCGKYIYVKLICPTDNRNGEHEGINIDCKYVIPFGNIINLGKEHS